MVTDTEIKNLSNTIVQHFNPEKIILFGSYAYGLPNENSDIDLLIVMDFKGKSNKKSYEIWSKIKPEFSVDFILKTPVDFIKRYNQGDPLIGDAVDNGKILYERNS